MNWYLWFVLAFLFLNINRAAANYSGPKSDHFDGEKFFNPSGGTVKGLSKVLKWYFEGGKMAWPDWVENTVRPQITAETAKGELAVTFVNHATVLVQFPGLNILTDPVWSERVSPFTWIGPKRHRAPGVSLEQLPKIDLVVVSHNHYDHLDIETLKKLNEKFSPVFLVALGDGDLLREEGMSQVVEMDWWQKHTIENAEVTFVPAAHWSGRGLNDRMMSLWGGFVIRQGDRSVYYSGDAGYSTHFTSIKEKLGSPDLALLPIGASEPRWFMKDQHMNPSEAVWAFKDLGAKRAMGIHFGTFQLTNEGINEPVKDLMAAKVEQGLADDLFFVLNEGESRRFKPGER